MALSALGRISRVVLCGKWTSKLQKPFHRAGSSVMYLSDITNCSNFEFMQTRYEDLKGLIHETHEQVFHVDERGIFAINQLNLGEVHVYGFDYDYTLAQYSEALQTFIYKAATEILVKKHQFPKQLMDFEYIPDFCIRGLHYDINKSLLMKVDSCNVVQLGTVHRGLQKLHNDEVMRLFNGSRHIPKHIIDQSYNIAGGDSIRQLMDIFAMPEMMLLANVIEFFTSAGIVYDPRILFESIQDAVRSVHVTGQLAAEVSSKIDEYLIKDSLRELMNYLTNSGKKLFLITNSGYKFVDVGLKHLIGPDWRDAFDVIIVQAKKPRFFHEGTRPFKRVVLDDTENTRVSWEAVQKFIPGQVYCEGCVNELMRLSSWSGNEVLYFGDQIYTDLSDPTHSYGWRTGAVIPELEDEIQIINSEMFGKSVLWLQTLERLLERMQIYRDAESQQLVRQWLAERNQLKSVVKEIFNPHFGSVFRSHLSPSFFAGRLCRIADLYMSSVNNLVHYYPNHFFFPLRGVLPHEHIISLAYQHDGFDYAIEQALKDKRQ
uniref:5'-nucleotidase domain-containing protein 3 n=1 Tax=Phallusia mammillata TaxID=59560 RepID=A0A6F9DM12_9ASCI|nr:5'-nucleotidase domain-containing protein 3 [Phallusia mammillata]